MQILLYGANGYTAQIMLPLMEQYGISPILAGRSEAAIAALAAQYGYPYRVFDVTNPQAVRDGIEGVKVVLHCAGPFIYTAAPMMDACITAGIHYLDITGEVSVFQMAHDRDAAARTAGITLMPGAGFDVVPTDCMARFLVGQLPTGTHLRLAFHGEKGGLSQGTALTMASTAGEGGLVRRDGKIERVPLGHWGGEIDFGEVQRFCMAIPWGDVFTAYHTTGIPNIEVYTTSTPATHRRLKWQWAFNWLLRTSWMRQRLIHKIKSRPAGPSEKRRTIANMYVWGQVRDAAGKVVTARYKLPEGYTLTAHTALLLAKKIGSGEGKSGFQTPAGLFGEDIVRQVKGLDIGGIEIVAT
jgi:short subunit dehydrogenase-like uncharacterized protein